MRRLTHSLVALALWTAPALAQQSAAFDGNASLGRNGNPLDGIYDSSFGTFSAWVKPLPFAQEYPILTSANGNFLVTLVPDNPNSCWYVAVFALGYRVSDGLAPVGDAMTDNPPCVPFDGNWHNVMAAWNGLVPNCDSGGDQELRIFIDNNDHTPYPAPSPACFRVDYSSAPFDWWVGRRDITGNSDWVYFNGSMAEVYFEHRYIYDLTDPSVRALFWNNGRAVDLGSYCGNPTNGNLSPIVCLRGNAGVQSGGFLLNYFGANDGFGGPFAGVGDPIGTGCDDPFNPLGC